MAEGAAVPAPGAGRRAALNTQARGVSATGVRCSSSGTS